MAPQPTSSSNGTLKEKLVRLAIPALLVFVGVKVWNAFAPSLIQAMENALIAIPLATVLVGGFLYVMANRSLLWMGYKNLCKKLSNAIVKSDPLGFMDRYVELLIEKLANLNKTIEVLRGKKIRLDREVNQLESDITSDLRLAKAAIEQDKKQQASVFGTKVAGNRETLTLLAPLQARTEKSLNFMTSLAENWGFSIEKLQFTVSRKRKEFDIIKETVKGLKSADDLINSNSEEAQVFGMSIKALEDSVTEKMGYIEEFERRSKGTLDSIAIEKQAQTDEGLKIIEDYMKNGNLELPDFSDTAAPQFKANPVPVAMSGNAASKFNLLKK